MPTSCYIDTNIFLNVIYAEPLFKRGSTLLLRAVQDGRLLGMTSSVTLMEVALDLAKTRNGDKIDQALSLIERTANLRVLPLDSLTVRLAAGLVLDNGITIHDAYHGATAIENNASVFVTRDRVLRDRLKDSISISEPEHVATT